MIRKGSAELPDQRPPKFCVIDSSRQYEANWLNQEWKETYKAKRSQDYAARTTEFVEGICQSQHFTSTAGIMQAMKETFRDVIQQVMEVEMDETLGRERRQRSNETEGAPRNYRNGYSQKTIKTQPGSPHAFQHTMASMLYFNGVDRVSISRRLGHAQVSTTANIYAHVMEEADQRNADILSDIFLKKA